MREWILRVVRLLRDGWVILGISLALFLTLEGLYVGQAALRRALRGEAVRAQVPSNHPYADNAWWPFPEPSEGGGVAPDPYRGIWGRYQRSPVVNVDSMGRRRVLQSATEGETEATVYMLGGSTMWGWMVRDAATIPTLVARMLDARGVEAEVVNLAQSTYTLTQETITLLLELAEGNRPDFVVFLDGNNEVATAFQARRAGSILNEDRWKRYFERGRREDVSSRLLLALATRSALVQRLQRLTHGGSEREEGPPADGEADALCRDVAAWYENLTRIVAALGREFDFDPLFFWQPLLATTSKSRTPWEANRRARPSYPELLRRCTAMVDSTMAHNRRTQFEPLTHLFDEDTATVFLDHYGHVTETANERIAELIVARVEAKLQNSPGRSRPRASAPGRR